MTRISLDRSFAEQAYTRMYSSNILYPSNHPNPIEIEDKGSVDRSFDYALEEKMFDWTRVKVGGFDKAKEMENLKAKVARGFLRAVVAMPICLVVAPLGMVCHVVLMAAHTLRADWQKVKEHARAFFTDACNFLWGLTMVGIAALQPLMAIEHGTVGAAIIIASFELLMGFFLAVPDFQMSFMTYRDERDSFRKAFTSKNYLGVTGPGGKLLTWDPRVDRELNGLEIVNGRLDFHYWNAWNDLRDIYHDFQVFLRDEKWLPKEHWFNPDAQGNGLGVINVVLGANLGVFEVGEASQIDVMQHIDRLGLENRLSESEVIEWIAKINIAFNRIYVLKHLLEECARYVNGDFGGKNVRFKWPKLSPGVLNAAFNISEKHVVRFVPSSDAAAPRSEQRIPASIPEKLQTLLRWERDPTNRNKNRVKFEFLERIVPLVGLPRTTDEDIFGLSHNRQYLAGNKEVKIQLLRTVYRRASGCFHPDKNAYHAQGDNEEIFKWLNEAYIRLEKEIEERR